MSTDLRDLDLFVAVLDAGSITGGAHACHLSLSAASTRITAMERTRGVELLQRSRRGVTATAAGEVLAAHARRVLAEAEVLERRMAAYRRGLRHEIHLAGNSSAVDMLTEFLADALTLFPETTIILEERSSADALREITTGEAHLAVVSMLAHLDGFQTRALWADPLVVVDGRARTTKPLSLRDVLRRPLIGLSDPSPLQSMIELEAFRSGTSVSYRIRLPSMGAVCAVAAAGAGPAIVPLGSARRAGLPDVALVPLTEPWAQRQATLVARDFAALSPSVSQFVDALLRYEASTP